MIAFAMQFLASLEAFPAFLVKSGYKSSALCCPGQIVLCHRMLSQRHPGTLRSVMLLHAYCWFFVLISIFGWIQTRQTHFCCWRWLFVFSVVVLSFVLRSNVIKWFLDELEVSLLAWRNSLLCTGRAVTSQWALQCEMWVSLPFYLVSHNKDISLLESDSLGNCR